MGHTCSTAAVHEDQQEQPTHARTQQQARRKGDTTAFRTAASAELADLTTIHDDEGASGTSDLSRGDAHRHHSRRQPAPHHRAHPAPLKAPDFDWPTAAVSISCSASSIHGDAHGDAEHRAFLAACGVVADTRARGQRAAMGPPPPPRQTTRRLAQQTDLASATSVRFDFFLSTISVSSPFSSSRPPLLPLSTPLDGGLCSPPDSGFHHQSTVLLDIDDAASTLEAELTQARVHPHSHSHQQRLVPAASHPPIHQQWPPPGQPLHTAESSSYAWGRVPSIESSTQISFGSVDDQRSSGEPYPASSLAVSQVRNEPTEPPCRPSGDTHAVDLRVGAATDTRGQDQEEEEEVAEDHTTRANEVDDDDADDLFAHPHLSSLPLAILAPLSLSALIRQLNCDPIPLYDVATYARLYPMYSDDVPEYQAYRRRWIAFRAADADADAAACAAAAGLATGSTSTRSRSLFTHTATSSPDMGGRCHWHSHSPPSSSLGLGGGSLGAPASFVSPAGSPPTYLQPPREPSPLQLNRKRRLVPTSHHHLSTDGDQPLPLPLPPPPADADAGAAVPSEQKHTHRSGGGGRHRHLSISIP